MPRRVSAAQSNDWAEEQACPMVPTGQDVVRDIMFRMQHLYTAATQPNHRPSAALPAASLLTGIKATSITTTDAPPAVTKERRTAAAALAELQPQRACQNCTRLSAGSHTACSAQVMSPPEVSKISLPGNLIFYCSVSLRQRCALRTPSPCFITLKGLLDVGTSECSSGLMALRDHCTDVNLVTSAFAAKKGV